MHSEYLAETRLNNHELLEVMQRICYFDDKERQLRVKVNYGDLDVEEFGSVYEGLLEYKPVFTEAGGKLQFAFEAGTERSSSGSHYTPEELVRPLIKHSLDYIIDDCLKKPHERLKIQPGNQPARSMQEKALLDIKVADVACGSGHILLSAARRIATELARVRTSEDQPSPHAMRQSIRDVIRHCIYGVDKNPLAVELCKVALWLEAHNPGEPLNFLDHRIKCGDSIVGLAHRDELQNGISDEAFKLLPGDDKLVAKTFRDQNKKERKEREAKQTQLKAEFEKSTTPTVAEDMATYITFSKLPETTPVEIARKQQAYQKYLDGRGHQWLKLMADTQVAQFFIPKTLDNQNYLITDADYRQMLAGYKGWQGQKPVIKAELLANDKRFFHWFIEFPEVFEKGGFDCVLGNPPFLGGQKLTGTFGNDFLEYLKYQYNPIGSVDLVTYFFRRIFTQIKPKGFMSLISTNTIAQGRAREDGLDVIVKQGGNINHAVKSMRWPGLAAVEVALVTLTKQIWKDPFILSGKEVKTITPYLDDAQTIGNPFPLKQNEGKSFQGSIVLGKGFVLTPEEAQALIAKDPKNKEVLFPYLNGDDLNNNPDQSPSRWVINFKDWPLRRYTQEEWFSLSDEDKNTINDRLGEEKVLECSPQWYGDRVALDYPDCLEIVDKLVKPERIKMTGDRGAEFWWQFLRLRRELYQSIANYNMILTTCRVSSTHAFGLHYSDIVFADRLFVFPCENFSDFLVLSSNLHEHWAWKYSSTMKNDRNYSASDCFETYPLPLTKQLRQTLQKGGELYFNYRSNLMFKIQLGFTKTYNTYHAPEIQAGITTAELQQLDKKAIEKKYGKELWNLWNHLQKTEGTCTLEEAIAGIVKLRELHVQMDQAVLEAYGWGFDSGFDSGFDTGFDTGFDSAQPDCTSPRAESRGSHSEHTHSEHTHPEPSRPERSHPGHSHPERSRGILLRHNFYEVDYLPENDRIRYTIHPDARKEVLKRLLELNHQYFEEEAKQGLHKEETVQKFYEQKGVSVPVEVSKWFEKGKSKAKPYKKTKSKTREVKEPQRGYGDLFDQIN
jgi:hypothetical protein